MRTLLLIVVFLSGEILPVGVEEYDMTLAEVPIHVELLTNGTWRAENNTGAELGLYQILGTDLHIISGSATNVVDMNQYLSIPLAIDWDTVEEITLAKPNLGSSIAIDRASNYIGLYQTNGYLGTNFIVTWTN